MYKFYRIVTIPIDYFFIGLVWLYKLTISPLKPKTCRFQPTCSTYMIECIKTFGSCKGIFLGIKRLFRCTPNGKFGYDPVPVNLKGDAKWLF